METWWTAYNDALDLAVFPSKSAPAREPLQSYLKRTIAAYPTQGAAVAGGFAPLSLFLDRRLGHLALLQLAGQAQAEAGTDWITSKLSRKRFSADLGVTRAHITRLLADGEGEGLLRRGAGASLYLAADLLDRVRLWTAHELAWVLAGRGDELNKSE